jgi:hypothetical protein
MGQPITVVEKPSSANPAILRLETNRPLSGMGHERYDEPPGELLHRPVDELARRLFAAGGVQHVHINGSVVTVTLGGGSRGEGLADVVRHLFLHYGDTPVETHVQALDEADASPESLADSADAPAAEESADDAPAPERPEPEVAEQEIEGIPNAELEPDAPAPEREPSPADPDDVAAAAKGESPAPPASADTPPVEPTGEVERAEAEPLEAAPSDVASDDPSAG